MSTKCLENDCAVRRIGWRQSPRLVCQVGQSETAPARQVILRARNHHVRVANERLHIHVFVGRWLDDMYDRKIDSAIKQRAVRSCRVGGEYLKRKAGIPLSKTANHASDKSFGDGD